LVFIASLLDVQH